MLRHRQWRQTKVGRAHDLGLAHGDTAEDLREIFAQADPDDQILDLAELAGRVRAFRISEELPDRLDISRNPSQAMGGALLVMRRAVGRRRLGCEPLAH